jgi:hypothetical protein
VWDGKVEDILEFEKHTTLTVNELFSKLKSAEVDRGLTTCLESLTNSHMRTGASEDWWMVAPSCDE